VNSNLLFTHTGKQAMSSATNLSLPVEINCIQLAHCLL